MTVSPADTCGSQVFSLSGANRANVSYGFVQTISGVLHMSTINIDMRILLLFTAMTICTSAQCQASWSPAPSPLKTRWAANVSPANARTEYPRPNAVRNAWANLNGMWEFAVDDSNDGRYGVWSVGH